MSFPELQKTEALPQLATLTSKHHGGGRSDSRSCLKLGFDYKIAILICCVNPNSAACCLSIVTNQGSPTGKHGDTKESLGGNTSLSVWVVFAQFE